MENILLFLVNLIVLNIDLRLLLRPFEIQLLNDLLLLVKRDVAVEDLTIKRFYFRLNVCQLVLCDLKISLRPQTHSAHLLSGSCVFLNDLVDFGLSIFKNLFRRFRVILLHRLNLLSQVLDLLFLLGHVVLMSLLLIIDFHSVIFVDGSLGIAELSCLLRLLLLEGLIACGILEHALRVLIAFGVEDLMVLFVLHLLLLLKLFLNLVLTSF